MKNNPLPYKWQALLTVSVGAFMATLDASIVNISLPTISNYFRVDLATVSWVVMVYLLTVTGTLLSFGKISDMTGRRPIYALGFIIFTLGSALCGTSTTVYLLILFRAIQAVGAAMLFANAPAIVTEAFPPTERGKALGLIGTVVALGLTTGPPLGGIITGKIGWQWIFYINVPVGVVGAYLAASVLKDVDHRRPLTEFDLAGAAAAFISLGALLLGMTAVTELGWRSGYVRSLFILSLVALFSFLLIERKVKTPVVKLSIFRNRLFTAGNISALLSYIALFATMFLMPFYLERVLGYSPVRAGLLLTTVPLTLSLVAPISGWLSDRIGCRELCSAGLAISCLGLILLATLGPHSTPPGIVLRLFVLGLGMGMFQAPNNSCVMGSVERGILGIAAGTLATMRNLGMVLGIAITSTVFSERFLHYFGEVSAKLAFVQSLHDAYLVAAGVCGIGIFTSLVRGK